jgi:hypothetical protein
MKSPLKKRSADLAMRLQITLACCACCLAFLAWLYPTWQQPLAHVTVLDIKSVQVQSIEWHDAHGTVQVERRTDKPGRVWVHMRPQGAAAALQTTPGNEVAEALFTKLAPLVAARDLGHPTPAQLHEFGLDPGQQILTLHTHSGSQHRVTVGGTTFGSEDSYLRAEDGRVYLLRAGMLSSLQAGGLALQDRHALGLQRRLFDRVVLFNQGHTQEFLQRPKVAPRPPFMALPVDPDTRQEAASAAVDLLVQLRVTQLQEAPHSGADIGKPVLQAHFYRDQLCVGSLTIGATGPRGAPAASSYFPKPFFLQADTVAEVMRLTAAAFQQTARGL